MQLPDRRNSDRRGRASRGTRARRPPAAVSLSTLNPQLRKGLSWSALHAGFGGATGSTCLLSVCGQCAAVHAMCSLVSGRSIELILRRDREHQGEMGTGVAAGPGGRGGTDGGISRGGQVRASILSKAVVQDPSAASLTHHLVFNGSAVSRAPSGSGAGLGGAERSDQTMSLISHRLR